MTETYLKLALIGVLPVFLSCIFYAAEENTKLHEAPYWCKQILFGVVFGLLSIAGTEFGVPLNGATLNARDAAPLCAGLIFGGPAGIIAGLMGGIERYFAVYWGAGSYTRLACSLATCFSGVYSAILRKYLFDDKVTSGSYGFAAGLVCEVIHMLLVFLTHMDDLKKAFSVVELCTLPMVIINSFAVWLAVIICESIRKAKVRNDDRFALPQQFQIRLLKLVVAAFILTSGFTYYIQEIISDTNTESLLNIGVNDVIKNIEVTSDTNLLDITRKITSNIERETQINEIVINDLLADYEVKEINVVDEKGVITYSSNPDFVGFDFSSGEQSAVFLCLLENETEYVQSYQPISYDASIQRKYAGRALKTGGFVQVGYDAEYFHKQLESQVKSFASNRHVGETGRIFVVKSDWEIASSLNEEDLGKTLEGFKKIYDEGLVNTVYETTYDGEDVYCMFADSEGYIIVSIYPKDEAHFSKMLAIYINTFMEITVFAGIFIFTFFLVKKIVVVDINTINNDLQSITKGDLDTVVEAENSREFASLSYYINQTVDKLKQFIAEASARIDKELKYAADIQRSALPSIFPPYPARDEFDIYASMNPAKEVGGDFYDFYLIKDNLIAFLVADVSGKGVPASLFMMRAKTLMKTYTEGGIEVNDVFTNANYHLCEGNEAGMFVTAWMGILDTKTGYLKFANAGHNPPCIRRKNGEFEYLKSKPGFILGGMESIVYSLQETTLAPGDTIFVYTDGVTEATSGNVELFGEDRLLNSLNKHKDLSAEELCHGVKTDVDEFVGEAPQFDDITMLCIKMIKFYEE